MIPSAKGVRKKCNHFVCCHTFQCYSIHEHISYGRDHKLPPEIKKYFRPFCFQRVFQIKCVKFSLEELTTSSMVEVLFINSSTSSLPNNGLIDAPNTAPNDTTRRRKVWGEHIRSRLSGDINWKESISSSI